MARQDTITSTRRSDATTRPACTTRQDASSARRRAFTLVELLVVVSIMSILLAMSFPVIGAVIRMTRGGAAETTIGVAVRTASAYAGKPKQTISNPDLAGTPTEFNSNGAAILFTPNGDIRILKTDLLATDSSGTYLQPDRFGYTDRDDRDYINLPDNTLVFGIIRTSGGIRLITPPFAVRFDQFGQASTGYGPADDKQMVFYDGDYNGRYNITITDGRPSNYNPNAWNNKSSEWNDSRWDANRVRPQLPFERIETVVGILTVHANDFNASGDPARTFVATGGYIESNTANWLLETDAATGKLKNAKPIFFSRNSGSILKGNN